MNVVKKRGRKPKNKIVINDNPCFDNKEVDIIIKINKDLDNDLDNDLDKDLDNNLDNDLDNDLDNYCKKCNKDIIVNNILPIKYVDNVFYIIDKFCCKKCCEEYIFEDCKYNKYETYSLYQLYHSLEKNNVKTKYINFINKKDNNNIISIDKTKKFKLYRGKKDNNILNFINKI